MFEIEQVPFSTFGSYLAVTRLNERMEAGDCIYIKTVHGGLHGIVFKLEPILDGVPVPYAINASPHKLRLETEHGDADICFEGEKVIRFRGRGIGLRFTGIPADPFFHALPHTGGAWEVDSYASRIKLMLIPISGKLDVNAPWEGMRCLQVVADLVLEEPSASAEMALEEYVSTWIPRTEFEDFDTVEQKALANFQDWMGKTPRMPEEFSDTRKLCAYINWSSVVAPRGHFTRPAMMMSKNWMVNVWSWDHCFNAMALCRHDPDLAWDQYMLMLDAQDEFGVLPDSINDKNIIWNFVKPPIHGWTLQWMMNHSSCVTAERIREAYPPLCKWTRWWIEHRDYDGDGIPQYNHGNDSGWDNCTVFHKGGLVESPDLASYLVIQMEVLAEMAEILGKTDEASAWSEKSRTLLSLMIEHNWRGDRFIAPISGTCQTVESDSLFLYLPIILGKRLPSPIAARLAEGLKEKGRFLTEYGLATESVASGYYVSDGYWRGPIWAPATMILVDGLFESGEADFARELALKFCRMVKTSGAAENFDALTGEGLRDRAYTWTSSVFLIFGSEYL